jgi:hypothetical protein
MDDEFAVTGRRDHSVVAKRCGMRSVN